MTTRGETSGVAAGRSTSRTLLYIRILRRSIMESRRQTQITHSHRLEEAGVDLGRYSCRLNIKRK